jgi:hypothetical protein
MTLKPNRGYDPNVFVVAKESFEVALLPNIGRFCKNKCGRRIKGTKVTRWHWRSRRVQTYELPPAINKVFCSKTCKSRFYEKTIGKKNHTTKNAVDCRIRLVPRDDEGQPFRLITLYLGKRAHVEVKITPDSGELWNVLNKIYKYRGMPKEQQEYEITPEILSKIMTVSAL